MYVRALIKTDNDLSDSAEYDDTNKQLIAELHHASEEGQNQNSDDANVDKRNSWPSKRTSKQGRSEGDGNSNSQLHTQYYPSSAERSNDSMPSSPEENRYSARCSAFLEQRRCL
jgi:hypothetical protein